MPKKVTEHSLLPLLHKFINGKTDWPLLFSKYEPFFNEIFNSNSKEEFYELRKLMLGH